MNLDETGPMQSPPPRAFAPALEALASRYELEGEIGRGGMGVVYRARQRNLERPVAIKLMLPGASPDRFLREARLLARIRSPHLVAVHDFEVLPDGCPVLVMEWIEGRDLGRLMVSQGGALPEGVALPLMREVALGMAAAADEGIVHRDLKPSNVLVDAAGHARVVDFGLARGPLPEASLSLSGQVLGTPFYMAPEQWEDPRGLDTRADVYAFGGTFYHALTGVAPFGGPSAVAVLLAHKTEPLVSPRARNPHLSEHTAEVLERCLAKRPPERFPSFHELAAALRPDAASPWNEPDDPALAPHLARYLSRRGDYLLRRLSEVDVYEFPAGRRLLVRPGSLADIAADALVSSDDGSLSMSSGVSRALREAAGPELAEAARRCAPARPGRCVVTPAGRLRARFVFHGITLDPGKGRVDRPSRDLISEIVGSCLYQADSLFVETLAFPLLGTGNAGLPEDVCLDTLFRALARALHGRGHGVREAQIVLWSTPRA